jgi:hypothetical protein
VGPLPRGKWISTSIKGQLYGLIGIINYQLSEYKHYYHISSRLLLPLTPFHVTATFSLLAISLEASVLLSL